MFRVGLTGGIASGKTTISELFSRLGVPVIDTDIISHQLMQPGQPAYLKTANHFGQNILNSDASLNRKLLRKLIFQDSAEKLWLESMIHPLIRLHTEQAVQRLPDSNYCLIVVPLLFETGFEQLVQHVIAIDCPLETQKKRLLQRDNIDETLANRMIQSQMRNEDRIVRADNVISNPDKSNPAPQVSTLHDKLLKLANLHPSQS